MIKLIQISFIAFIFYGCECGHISPQVSNLGTFTPKYDSYWFPNDSIDRIVFVDSLGFELQFIKHIMGSRYDKWRDYENSICTEFYGLIETKQVGYINFNSGYSIEYSIKASDKHDLSSNGSRELGKITISNRDNLVNEMTQYDSLKVNAQFNLNGQIVNTYKQQLDSRLAHFCRGYGIIYFEDCLGNKWTLKEY